jgi:hypothetical protein
MNTTEEGSYKIPAEDLERINKFLKNKELLKNELGIIKLSQLELEERENNAKLFRKELLKEESEISKKYGNGVLNTDEGTFAPNS